MNVVGVPKTIDNDLGGTDVTFGFDTALQIATEAIDRLHTTAESHNRILVVEVMGRTAGWIALHSGIAGGADVILIPEIPFDIDEVCRLISRRHERGRYFSIVVAAEGAAPKEGTMAVARENSVDEFGHPRLGGIGYALEREIETAHRVRDACDGARTRPARRHPDARSTGCSRRGSGWRRSTPSTTAHGARMAALRGNQIELVELADAVAEVRRVPLRSTNVSESFLGRPDLTMLRHSCPAAAGAVRGDCD